MLQSTGSGGLGTVKMFQALRVQSTEAVVHLSRWFFMVNRTYEGKLKAYEVRTL